MSKKIEQAEFNFEEVDLAALHDKFQDANKANKHVFLWDKTGQVPVYHEGPVVEFTEQMVQVALAKKHDVNEILTQSLQ